MNILFQNNNSKTLYLKFLLFIPLLYLFNPASPQEIKIKGTREPLNTVLINLRTEYGVMLSFDDACLSSFTVTADTAFHSVESALDFLMAGLPLKYENNNGVFVIYRFQTKKKLKKFILSGQVTDITSHETLPFTGLQINGVLSGSDVKGNFSVTSTNDSVFKIRISHIGYYYLDTIVRAGTDYDFRLMPSVIGLKEIIVKGSMVARTIQTGNSPGIISLNHKIAYYLPGNGDNSVFNLLRLQPGILASGEQSSDLIIWGSYEGQSQILFDGFTIYGMKNFNDNISAVNPYMAKDIKVMKGGFGAEYGERVGGIVDITGSDGNLLVPSFRFCINNMTINGMASIPVNKNSSFLLAYRQTYYDLYNPVNFSTSGFGRGSQNSNADYYLTPDYFFRDLNLKYSLNRDKSNFYVSFYGGNDRFSYNFNQETMQKDINLAHSEKDLQIGGTIFYGLRWKNKNTTNFITSFSSLLNDWTHIEDISRTSGSHQSTVNNYNQASINEINGRIENTFNISEKHRINAGTGLLYYTAGRNKQSFQQVVSDLTSYLSVPYLYLQENYTINKKLIVRPGLRLDYHSTSGKIFMQPRFSFLYRINEHLEFSSAAGTYNQFVAKNMHIETSGNYWLEWAVCNSKDVSVLNSKILSAGFTYKRNGFTFNSECYLKTIGNVTRHIETVTSTGTFTGDCKIKGLDVFIKKDFRDQTFWISYTLSKTVERFPYFPDEGYVVAIQDQRHELKLAALTKFKSLHFSVNYVYGSGLPDPDKLPEVAEYAQPYSRLDAALIFLISKKKINVDAGVSVLNVLNKENIRYSNYTRIPTDETTTISLYTETVPFTPTIFLNIYF